MLEPDSDTRRMLARERQDSLTRDAGDAPSLDRVVTESRSVKRRRSLYVPLFRLHVRLARGGS
jgi:hypothetical protein